METTKKVINKSIEAVLKPVYKVETSSLFNRDLKIASDKSQAIIRENEIIGFVSPNFSLIKPMDFHSEIIPRFENLGINVESTGRIDSKGNWEIRYQTNGGQFAKDWKTGDEINPFVNFFNGLAGTKSGGGSGGALRKVCSNGMTANVVKEIFEKKVRNTQNTQNLKFGIDFDFLIQKYLIFFESFDQVLEEQKKIQDREFKKDLILPVFMELTKGTKFPQQKFQSAFDRIAFEAKEIGYTEMNSYLAYSGLNYILEHDSMALDINQVKEIDQTISARLASLDLSEALQNYNNEVQAEKERIEAYKVKNDGKEPRGKRKVLELDLTAF